MYIFGAIITTPIVIMILNKFYHAIYNLLFPCVETERSFRCIDPMMPAFLTFMTSIILVAFVVYVVTKGKLNIN